MANVQYQYHYYRLYDDKRFDVAFKKSFDFISPRAGVNYNLNQNIGLFASVSTSSRHPAFKDIYDPTDYWSNPAYKPDNFRAIGLGWDYIGKEIKPEKLLDFELGSDFKFDAGAIPISGSLNLYRMQITDEILPYAGQIDDMGYPISGNADKTLHQGVELSADAAISKTLTIGGNVSANDDHFVKYKEYGFDYDNWVALEYDRSDKRIGGFPKAIANYSINWAHSSLQLGLNGNHIGSQYIDNGETYKLNSFNLLGGTIAYDLGHLLGFRALLATARINNIANLKYAAAAYIDYDDNLPRYMVGAERNFYLSLKASF
jgi:iron complex outermembrane recepter protein